MSCKSKQTLQHSCSTGAFERETEHTGAVPNGADRPEEQWPGNIYSTTLEPQNCNQTSTKIDGPSVAVPAAFVQSTQIAHEATNEFSTMVVHALAVAGNPGAYPLRELKMAVAVLEHEQQGHGSNKHCPKDVMHRINKQLLVLATAISNRGVAGISTTNIGCHRRLNLVVVWQMKTLAVQNQ